LGTPVEMVKFHLKFSWSR